MIGKTISHYKIFEKLGQGGMGVVYKAEDTRLKRKVALKFLPDALSQNSEEKIRFIREAQAAGALDHPNITTVHGIEETDRGSFIVMSYIKGITLKEMIKSGPLPVDQAMNITIQIAQGLKNAHDHGIIHRDIKSSNIIITSGGQVKITDFGLAKFKGERTLTNAGSQLGTAAYMSPEQIKGETVDQQSDLFSLGVVLFEMLTGQLPFKGEDEHSIMFSIVFDTYKSIHSLKKGIPIALGQTVEKSLYKDKTKRYQTVDEFLDDLNETKKFLNSNKQYDVYRKKAGTEKKLFTQIKERQKVFLLGLFGLIFVATTLAVFLSFLNSNNQVDSLAVLPFENVGADPNMEYLSDGITEILIFKLSKLPNLKVIAPSSVFRIKGKGYNLQDVAKELDVTAIVKGKVNQQNDNLSISIEFVDATDNRLIWGNQYRRRSEDMIQMQEVLVSDIIEKLKLNLTERQISRVAKSYTENIEVYQLYLKGRFFLSNRTKHDIYKAIKFFEQAIEKDSNYSLAYAGLSDCYSFMPFYAAWKPEEAFPKARAAAIQALKLDTLLAEAYVSLATVQHFYDWDFPKARESLIKAINLKPGLAEAHFRYGIYTGNLGRAKESIKSLRKALILDPLSRSINTNLGDALLWARRYDEAIRQYNHALELDPNYYQIYWGLGKAFLQKKMYQEAVEAFQKSGSKEIVYAYTVLGKKDKALPILKDGKKVLAQRYVDQVFFARMYYGLGEIDSAFQALEQAYQNRSPKLIDELYCEPFYDGLRDDPRYEALIKRIGFEK